MMNNALELMPILIRLGVKPRVRDGKLLLESVPAAIAAAVATLVRPNRQALIEILTAPERPDAAPQTPGEHLMNLPGVESLVEHFGASDAGRLLTARGHWLDSISPDEAADAELIYWQTYTEVEAARMEMLELKLELRAVIARLHELEHVSQTMPELVDAVYAEAGALSHKLVALYTRIETCRPDLLADYADLWNSPDDSEGC